MKQAGKISVMMLAATLALAACGQRGSQAPSKTGEELFNEEYYSDRRRPSTTLREFLLGRRNAEEKIGAVNKYLWKASLDVLSFLPVQSADPFTGLITTGYGTPPGGGRAYKATILISDPALDARSINVSLQSRGGPVSASTARSVEDAIMARARQIRGNDAQF